jgi:transposase
MRLSDHDLRQLDEAYLKRCPEARLREVAARLLRDLKEARDRLHQTPQNSSRPPSSQAPWDRPPSDAAAEGADDEDEPPPPASPPPCARRPASGAGTPAGNPRRPGKQPGAPGRGRSERIAITHREIHRPARCAACGAELPPQAEAVAYGGYDELDLAPWCDGAPGLRLLATRHTLVTVRCECGHRTRAEVYRAEADPLWDGVELTGWRLVGPQLAALIVLLALRMRLSRARSQELLHEWFGLWLATGTLDRTIREAGRAAEPLLDELAREIQTAELLHVDETPWPERGRLYWLWVLVTPLTVLYLIGERTRALLGNVLEEVFAGTLMSDGYGVYRAWDKRLRCWAHLARKLRGLRESSDRRVARLGRVLEARFTRLRDAVYAARASPPTSPLPEACAGEIARLRRLCERHRHDPHERVRALSREFLRDWDVILRPLAEPELPLTNNAAEQALRHWVIARRLSYGTRSPTGSRAFALLASVIDTCRRRNASPRNYLTDLITQARQGATLPTLPAPLSARGE